MTIRKFFLSLLVLVISFSGFAGDRQAVLQLIKRIIPERASQFDEPAFI